MKRAAFLCLTMGILMGFGSFTITDAAILKPKKQLSPLNLVEYSNHLINEILSDKDYSSILINGERISISAPDPEALKAILNGRDSAFPVDIVASDYSYMEIKNALKWIQPYVEEYGIAGIVYNPDINRLEVWAVNNIDLSSCINMSDFKDYFAGCYHSEDSIHIPARQAKYDAYGAASLCKEILNESDYCNLILINNQSQLCLTVPISRWESVMRTADKYGLSDYSVIFVPVDFSLRDINEAIDWIKPYAEQYGITTISLNPWTNRIEVWAKGIELQCVIDASRFHTRFSDVIHTTNDGGIENHEHT